MTNEGELFKMFAVVLMVGLAFGIFIGTTVAERILLP